MTLAFAPPPRSQPQPFAPAWARGALLAAVFAAHAFVFLRLSSEVPVTPLPSIAIDFTPLPEPVATPPAEEPPMAEAPSEPPPEAPPDEPAPVPDPPPPDETPPPQDVTPPPLETVPPPPAPVVNEVAPLPPKTPPKKSPPVRTPAPKKAPAPVARPAAPRPVVSHSPEPQRSPAPAAAPAAPAAPAMSAASFASLVAAELNRHKAYPESARASGASGAVGVAFTIGPSGHATVISITSSSGNSALDSAARQAVASIRVPPPPGGIFRTATTIRFSLR